MGLEHLKKSLNAKQAIPSVHKKSEGGNLARACAKVPAASTSSNQAEERLGSLVSAEPAVRRIMKRAATLAERITEEDMEAGMQALRNALRAENVIYDKSTRRLVRTPDAKTQLAAFALTLAYTEGTPVKRIAAIVGNTGSAEDRVNALKSSPEMVRAVKALSGLGVDVIDIETESEPVQETGSGNDDVA